MIALRGEGMCPLGEQRQISRTSHSENARSLSQALGQLLVERNDLLIARIFVWRQINRNGQHVLWPETGIGIKNMLKTSHQQSGADQEHHRKRHLDDYEHRASALAVSTF